MRVAAVNFHIHSVMWNEARILPYWLRHYEQYAERIFVWDAQSDDGTRELLDAHPLVTVFDQTCTGLDDHYFTECFMRYRDLSKDADWCLCVAADEFIYREYLMRKLGFLTEQRATKVQMRGYTMYATHFPTTTGQIYEEVQHGYPDIWSRKTVLFNPKVEMQWMPGLHVEFSGDKPVRDSGIKLLHYRYLGPDYYLQRTRRNYQRWQQAGLAVEFDFNRRHNLPDGSRGNPYRWYEDNTDKLVKVVEDG